MSSRARAAVAAHVRGADDRRLERTLASRPALRVLFAVLARRFDPVGAAGFTGTVRFELSASDGRERVWAIVIAGDGTVARAVANRAVARAMAQEEEAALVVRASAADFVRLSAGVLHPARALLSGRLDVAGDFGVARRLGPMFGLAGVL